MELVCRDRAKINNKLIYTVYQMVIYIVIKNKQGKKEREWRNSLHFYIV